MTAGDEAQVFRTALVQAELTMSELWLRYIALGGTATAVVCRADPGGDVNERFSERDLDHPLPYHRS